MSAIINPGGSGGGIAVTLSSNTAGVLALVSSGTLTLAGGNNVTLSQAGNAITISAANETQTVPPIGTNINSVASANSTGTVTRFAPEDHRHEGLFSAGVSTGGNTAGNTSVGPGQFVLAGGANITLSQATAAGKLMTVSVVGGAGAAAAAISAGTQSVNSGTVIFSNSNGISFGMSGSQTITASYTVPTETPFGVSAGTQSVSTGTVVFSNSNGISFGMSNSSIVTASYTVPTVTNSSWSVSDAATSGTVARLAFTNLNGVTLSLSSGAGGSHTIVGSHNALTSQSNQAFSAAGGSSAFQTLSFADTNSVSFTNTGGSIGVASIKLQLFAVSNTTQSSSGTADHTALSFGGAGIASVGVTGGSVVISVPSGGGGGAVVSNAIQDVGTATGSGTNTSRFAADDHVHRGVRGIVASGTATTFFGDMVLSGGSNITLSTAGASTAGSIAIHGRAGPNIDYWANLNDRSTTTHMNDAQLHLAPLWGGFPGYITVSGADAAVTAFFSGVSNASFTASHTLSMQFGIYALSNSTALSAIATCSTTFGSTTGASNSASYHGVRMVSLPGSIWGGANSSFALTPGNYWWGVWIKSAGAQSEIATNIKLLGGAFIGNNFNVFSGMMGQSTNTTKGAAPFWGVMRFAGSTTQASLQTSVALTQMQNATTTDRMMYQFIGIGGTGLGTF